MLLQLLEANYMVATHPQPHAEEGHGRAPVSSMMRSSWFMVLLPGKMGLPFSSSPRMQPAQFSTSSDQHRTR
jgi:hypothetical protein